MPPNVKVVFCREKHCPDTPLECLQTFRISGDATIPLGPGERFLASTDCHYVAAHPAPMCHFVGRDRLRTAIFFPKGPGGGLEKKTASCQLSGGCHATLHE